MRILLCDDDPSILQTVGDLLAARGVTVDYCSRGTEAVDLAGRSEYDVIVLDVSMPRLSGLDACHQMRAAGVLTPILFLTARDRLEDTLAGFDAGGDDYVVKPFEFDELLARLQALGRRVSRSDTAQLKVGDLVIDPTSAEVSRAGHPLSLNRMQFRLLKCLALKSPGVVSRAELEHCGWGDEPPDSDALRTHVFNLRALIDKPFETPLLRTVRGIGYRLCEPGYPETDDDAEGPG